MVVPYFLLNKYINILRDNSVSVTYWDRGRDYGSSGEVEAIKNCDAFIIVLPFNDFKMPIQKMPSGIYGELTKAMKLGKRIILAYESSEGPKFYETVIDKLMLAGLPGTGHTFLQDMDSLKNELHVMGRSITRDEKGNPYPKSLMESTRANDVEMSYAGRWGKSLSMSDVSGSMSPTQSFGVVWLNFGPDRRLLLL